MPIPTPFDNAFALPKDILQVALVLRDPGVPEVLIPAATGNKSYVQLSKSCPIVFCTTSSCPVEDVKEEPMEEIISETGTYDAEKVERAGTDRLDKELMIGQMQGKYQLLVFPDVGHSLQEDAPQRTAQILVEFWRRNEMVDVKTIKSLRKVGES